MRDLIGVDGGALAIEGLALPYGEWIVVKGQREQFRPGALARQFAAGVWQQGIRLEWQHDTYVIAEAQRVEVLDAPLGLWFRAVLPDTGPGRHAAQSATGGRLGASVVFHECGRDPDGTVRMARLASIGLAFTPAYDTVAWRSDARPEDLSPEVRAWRTRFVLADMDARARGHMPLPKPPADVVDINARAAARRRQNSADRRYLEQAAASCMRAVRNGSLDRELDEMRRLSRGER